MAKYTIEELVKDIEEIAPDKPKLHSYDAFVTAIAADLGAACAKVLPGFDNSWIVDRGEKLRATIDPERWADMGKTLGKIVEMYEENRDQDILGALWNELGLPGETGTGIPTYESSKLVAATATAGGEFTNEIDEKGYTVVHDPHAGVGTTVLACSNHVDEIGYNAQSNVFFAVEEPDELFALACFVQMCLMGCAGFICVGSAENPDHLLVPSRFFLQPDLWPLRFAVSNEFPWKDLFMPVVIGEL